MPGAVCSLNFGHSEGELIFPTKGLDVARVWSCRRSPRLVRASLMPSRGYWLCKEQMKREQAICSKVWTTRRSRSNLRTVRRRVRDCGPTLGNPSFADESVVLREQTTTW